MSAETPPVADELEVVDELEAAYNSIRAEIDAQALNFEIEVAKSRFRLVPNRRARRDARFLRGAYQPQRSRVRRRRPRTGFQGTPLSFTEKQARKQARAKKVPA